MNSHCWPITCTGITAPLGFATGFGPLPLPAPLSASSAVVPKIARKSTAIVVVASQAI